MFGKGKKASEERYCGYGGRSRRTAIPLMTCVEYVHQRNYVPCESHLTGWTHSTIGSVYDCNLKSTEVSLASQPHFVLINSLRSALIIYLCFWESIIVIALTSPRSYEFDNSNMPRRRLLPYSRKAARTASKGRLLLDID